MSKKGTSITALAGFNLLSAEDREKANNYVRELEGIKKRTEKALDEVETQGQKTIDSLDPAIASDNAIISGVLGEKILLKRILGEKFLAERASRKK